MRVSAISWVGYLVVMHTHGCSPRGTARTRRMSISKSAGSGLQVQVDIMTAGAHAALAAADDRLVESLKEWRPPARYRGTRGAEELVRR